MSYQTLYYQAVLPEKEYGELYEIPISIPHGPTHVYHQYVYHPQYPQLSYTHPFDPSSYSPSRPFVYPVSAFIGTTY